MVQAAGFYNTLMHCDEPALVVGLLYGSGLRLMEALRLRVKDLDLQRCEITVRDGQGGKDRLTVLPQSLVPALRLQLSRVRNLHQSDLAAGWGRVVMPFALARKYPNANREWAWQMGVSPTEPLAR